MVRSNMWLLKCLDRNLFYFQWFLSFCIKVFPWLFVMRLPWRHSCCRGPFCRWTFTDSPLHHHEGGRLLCRKIYWGPETKRCRRADPAAQKYLKPFSQHSAGKNASVNLANYILWSNVQTFSWHIDTTKMIEICTGYNWQSLFQSLLQSQICS